MKNVLLSGCTRGLGLAIAERLVADGYRVIGLGRALSDGYADLQRRAGEEHAVFVAYDLEDVSGIPALVAGITRTHGALYGLVNNAGIGSDGVLATMHATDILRVLTVNLHAAILLAKYGCRSMLTEGEGRIINISSIIASTGFSGLSVYGASKAGLEGFTRSLSRELGRARITVNAVAPGYMETEMTASLTGDKLESVRRRAPLGLPSVQDAAGAVAFLLSADAARMTGSVMTVDGGASA